MAERDLGKEMEALREDVARLRADLAKIAESLKDIGVEEAVRTKSAVGEMAQALIDEVRTAFESAKGKGKSSVEAVEHKIGDRPFVSLLTAFGTGIILGKMLDRR